MLNTSWGDAPPQIGKGGNRTCLKRHSEGGGGRSTRPLTRDPMQDLGEKKGAESIFDDREKSASSKKSLCGLASNQKPQVQARRRHLLEGLSPFRYLCHEGREQRAVACRPFIRGLKGKPPRPRRTPHSTRVHPANPRQDALPHLRGISCRSWWVSGFCTKSGLPTSYETKSSSLKGA